ncbi:Phosphate-selective porin [Bacteroidales bacterium Barb4]|nr:Phosphate-selective porin [Bacteroidales bacterium Barb4]
MKTKLWLVLLAVSFNLCTLSAQEEKKGFTLPGLANSYDLKFGGYGLLLYQYDDANAVKPHEFKPRVAFLWMEGKISNTIRYTVMAEAVSAKMYEYYMDWVPSNAFKVRAGQFKTAFTLETPVSMTVLESVNYARSVSTLAGHSAGMGLAGGGGRDIGVQVSGSLLENSNHSYVHYWAGLIQGTGINTVENNNTKDFYGTLALEPLKGFRVSGGLYAGQARYQKAGATVEEDHVRNRWLLGADYKTDRLSLRTEWLHGNDGGIQKEGLYGTAQWYFVPKKFNAFVKADRFNTNKEIDATATDYIVGANYYVANGCRFQLNYQHSEFSDTWTADKSADKVFLQLQVVF